MTTEELLKELSEVGLGVMASDHMSEVKRANVCSMVIKALSAEVEAAQQYTGTEYLRSDFQTAGDMRKALEKAEAERDALKAEVENLKTIIRAHSVGVVASAREAALAQAGEDAKPAAQNGGAQP